VESLYRLLDGTVEALEFTATARSRSVLGVPLKDLRLKKGVLLAAIVRGGKTIIPGGMTAIEEDDRVVVVTTNTGLQDLEDILVG
jgi:trk system potassium uptake protein TrkA